MLIFSSNVLAEDIALTIEQYDSFRKTVSIGLLDSSQVPLGTKLRIHTKTGTCLVKITERVNDSLIGATEGCETGILNPGMKLAYSPDTNWDSSTPEISTTTNEPSEFFATLQERVSVYVGHNFSRQLEGKVIADGSVKDLEGDTAFSLGANARVYDFNDRVSLGIGLGYETARTLDRETVTFNGTENTVGTIGYSPRLALWTLSAQAEAQVIDKLIGFGGLNYSIPLLSNSPFSMNGDLGFQAGANYQIFPQIALEGLIKISNMNLKNNIGETTDVSLAGLELRGRYSF